MTRVKRNYLTYRIAGSIYLPLGYISGATALVGACMADSKNIFIPAVFCIAGLSGILLAIVLRNVEKIYEARVEEEIAKALKKATKVRTRNAVIYGGEYTKIVA